MFIAGLSITLPTRKKTALPRGVGCYDQLVHNVFQPTELASTQGRIIAFTATSPGAGTSFVTRELGAELARYGRKKVLVVDARRLEVTGQAELERWCEPSRASGSLVSFRRARAEDIEERPPVGQISLSLDKSALWQGNPAFRQERMRLLRRHFDYVLVDCQSIRTSGEVLPLTRLVDGVVIVAAAGQTSHPELKRSQQVIEMAQGNILGFILNKRRYPVPDWLYRRI